MSGYEIVNGVAVTSQSSVSVFCPTGKVIMSAGFKRATVGEPFILKESYPTSGGGGWTFVFQNFGAGSVTTGLPVPVHAVCASQGG